jgi:hypothetical protein
MALAAAAHIGIRQRKAAPGIGHELGARTVIGLAKALVPGPISCHPLSSHHAVARNDADQFRTCRRRLPSTAGKIPYGSAHDSAVPSYGSGDR